MARQAERLLADTGWLPEPLRLAGVDDGAAAEPFDHGGADEALPAFLTEDADEDDAAEADEEERSMIVAE
jgi:ParB family chromosome partitioning protein